MSRWHLASYWRVHPDAVPRLREMWASGVRAEDIASRLGDGCTRNMVIGKAWRLRPRARGVLPYRDER